MGGPAKERLRPKKKETQKARRESVIRSPQKCIRKNSKILKRREEGSSLRRAGNVRGGARIERKAGQKIARFLSEKDNDIRARNRTNFPKNGKWGKMEEKASNRDDESRTSKRSKESEFNECRRRFLEPCLTEKKEDCGVDRGGICFHAQRERNRDTAWGSARRANIEKGGKEVRENPSQVTG